MAADLPSAYGTKAEYATYIKGLAESYPAHGDATETAIHAAFVNLILRSTATKVFAVDSGNWSTAANWEPSGVPGAGAIVLIGEGVDVTYDVNSTASLLGLRQDGILTWRTDIDTKLVCDTWTAMGNAEVIIGDEDDPIDADKTALIIVPDNGAISLVSDPALLGRGQLWHGHVHIHGAVKTPFLKVATKDGPLIGATSLTLESVPVGWRIGDEIVIGGQRPQGWWFQAGYTQFHAREHELRTITAINGAVVSWTTALVRDHSTPPHSHSDGDDLLRVVVANLTRNVKFQSANPAVVVSRRPHQMFMHSHHVDARWFEVTDYGRTNKYAGWFDICILQSVAANTDALLNGAFVSGGVATFNTLFQVVPQFNGIGTLTVTGTDANGDPQTETFTRTTSGIFQFDGDKLWTTVTQVRPNAAITSLQVGINAIAFGLVDSSGLKIKNFHGNSNNPSLTTNDTIKANHNLQGRYSIHIHRVGVDSLDEPPLVKGAVARGTPSWGIVHHDSHANVIDCVAYDFFGSGIVAEIGNETGLWLRNCAIGARAGSTRSIKHNVDMYAHDFGKNANGFWFTGRAIKVKSCIAVDCSSSFTYEVRGATGVLQDWQFPQPTCIWGRSTGSSDDHPIAHFEDNECANCEHTSFTVVKANSLQGHDVRSMFKRTLVWGCGGGAMHSVQYTEHYTFEDLVLINGYNTSVGTKTAKRQNGHILGPDQGDQVMVRPYIEGVTNGIDLYHDSTIAWHELASAGVQNMRVVIEPTFVNVNNNYVDVDSVNWPPGGGGVPGLDQFLDMADLGSTLSLSIDAVGVMPFTGNAYLEVRGDKTDSTGTWPWPLGFDGPPSTSSPSDPYFKIDKAGFQNFIAEHGYRVNAGDSKKYVFMHAWYSDGVTGELKLKILPVEPNASYILASTVNKGACNIALTTAPTLANFSVDVTQNTLQTIGVLSRATHGLGAAMELAGTTEGMLGTVIDNGDGTIGYLPCTDELYTEQFYVFVQDANANVTRATVTVNVVEDAGVQVVPVSFGETDFETATDPFSLLTANPQFTSIASAVVTGGAGVGTVSIGAAPGYLLTFDPADDVVGAVAGTAVANPGAVTINWSGVVLDDVTPPTYLPADVGTVAETSKRGVPKQLNVLASTTDPQDFTTILTQCSVRGGESNGRLLGDVFGFDGTVTVVPALLFTGVMTLDIAVFNGHLTSYGTATIDFHDSRRLRLW